MAPMGFELFEQSFPVGLPPLLEIHLSIVYVVVRKTRIELECYSSLSLTPFSRVQCRFRCLSAGSLRRGCSLSDFGARGDIPDVLRVRCMARNESRGWRSGVVDESSRKTGMSRRDVLRVLLNWSRNRNRTGDMSRSGYRNRNDRRRRSRVKNTRGRARS